MGLDRDKIVKKLDNRIKAQKFVYFGKKLGLPLGYDFDLYLYGPYSTKLADDYYSMSEADWKSETLTIPDNIKSALRYLRGKDALFLEIAATLDSIRTVNKGVSNSTLIDVVSRLKSARLIEKGKDKDYLKTVLDSLYEHNIF